VIPEGKIGYYWLGIKYDIFGKVMTEFASSPEGTDITDWVINEIKKQERRTNEGKR